MASFDDFTAACRAIFRQDLPLPERLAGISAHLASLVQDEAFVAATFGPDSPPKRLIFQDPDTGIHVLAHVFLPGVGGNPHSHAPSWAVYANARGQTQMREFARTNPPSDEHVELKEIDRYTMKPGDSRAYPSTAIHAPHHEETAWVVRVTGGDLDAMERWRFRKGRDRIVE